MALNTGLIGQLPYMQKEDTSYIPQSFMHSYEIAKRQNDPLEALRRASIEMDLTAKSFEISKHFEDRQRLLDAESQARQAAPSIQSLLQQQKPYEALLALQTEAAKNPNLLNSPTWNSLGKTVSTSAEISDKLKDTEARVLRDRETMRHNQVMETRGSPAAQDAERLAKLKQELRQSKSQTDKVAEVTPELPAELSRQQFLEDQIKALEYKTQGFEPEVKELSDGTKVIFNRKTGANRNADKVPTKKEFIAQNITKWMDEFGSVEKAAEEASKFYDANIGGSVAPAAKTTAPELRLGQIVKQNGVPYRFMGGDQNDPKNFTPVK